MKILKRIIKYRKTGMRNELIKGNNITILNDSYKSNPSSVLVALSTMYFMKGYDQKSLYLETCRV